MKHTSYFSWFFRKAPPAEKRKVMLEVAKEASEEQKKLLDEVKRVKV